MSKNTSSGADDKLIVSKALDAVDIAERQYTEKTVGFLDPHQVRVASSEIFGKVPSDIKTEFFGGYDEAERCMFICYPEYIEPDYDNLIAVLEITGRDIAQLSHRDYLGSLMGLGIKRENIGDILPFEDKCIVFVRPEMAGYITENLTKIGRHGISIKKVVLSETSVPKKKTQFMRETVAALRLDCIVSAALNVSRSKAADLIKAEKVNLNFETAKSVSSIVSEGDLISVRSFGRFKLTEICGITRKGRNSIIIEKYI